MCTQASSQRLPRRADSLKDALGKFLTPLVWRQACQHETKTAGRRKRRWNLHPLVLCTLAMTWCCGDSAAERFEMGKAFCVACQVKRRRPGKTFTGFRKALSRTPTAVWKCLAAAVRRQLQAWFAARWRFGEWVPFSVDGSRLECPRTQELERRLGQAGKEGSAPAVWVTTMVQLRWGLLWSWRLGTGKASEREHLRQLVPTLPAQALVVADAGFGGYEVAQNLTQRGVPYLIRMCSNITLYTDGQPRGLRDQQVCYWPKTIQKRHGEPLRARLLRIRARKGQGKNQRRFDVYLLTNVLEPSRLSIEQAEQLYRWRWQNEGLFRTFKRTLAKVKLLHRSVRLIHREADGALLATQLLLALGAWQVRSVRSVRSKRTTTKQRKGTNASTANPSPMSQDNGPMEARRYSPRQILLAIREEILASLGTRQRLRFAARLAAAHRPPRQQHSAKTRRSWARRYDHEPPKPPKIRKMTERQKRQQARDGVQRQCA